MAEISIDSLTEALRLALQENERLRQSDVSDGRAAVGPSEAVAVVAASCRFPGDVASFADLWRLVRSGTDTVTELPKDRGWDIDDLYDPDPDQPGKTYVRYGSFIHDAPAFDAAAFDISPREALVMDPQQRLVLECAWQAFEHAGLTKQHLKGSSTGVYIGARQGEYVTAHALTGLPDELEGYGGTAGEASVISGRVAYHFGLEGPAITIDTACSSSLVAIHLACQALQDRHCDHALAGGVSLVTSPATFVTFSRQRGLAADGRVKSFSNDADGTAWGEGAGLVLLKRLSDAVRDDDQVLGLIRGTAVNQDGASNGLTAPSGRAQERVIRQALINSRLTPGDIDVVEAHGSGTRLGDPIEARALQAVYGPHHGGHPLYLGSVKTNIGHTQAAAGIAGILKMLLAIQHQQLPASLHVASPTKEVDWDERMQLLTEMIPWPQTGRPRRAGVSSFGISGTNAHVILEQAPELMSQVDSNQDRWDGPTGWVLSGRGVSGLRSQARAVAEHVRRHSDLPIADVAYTLAASRTLMDHRAVIFGKTKEELLAGIDALAGADEPLTDKLGPHVVVGAGRSGSTLTMIFAGQGTQHPGMGRDLYRSYSVFRRAADELNDAFKVHLNTSILDLMFALPDTPEAKLLGETRFAQAAIFLHQVCLHRIMSDVGLTADTLIGHSFGELATAHVAGVFDLENAARLVCARGDMMESVPAVGAMTSLNAPAEEVKKLLRGHEAEVGIAAFNAPRNTVISGERNAVNLVAEKWIAEGGKVATLESDRAFHSFHLDPFLQDYETALRQLTFGDPHTPVISGLTGRLVDPALLVTPSYWVDQARQPVQFAEAIRSIAAAEPSTTTLELGPTPTLTALVRLHPEATQTRNFHTQHPKHDQVATLQAALAKLHTTSHPHRFERSQHPEHVGRKVSLPSYRFDRNRYWLRPAAGVVPHGRRPRSAVIGVPRVMATGHVAFGATLDPSLRPWLAEHAVGPRTVAASTTLIEMVAEAGHSLVQRRTIRDLTIATPLVIDGNTPIDLEINVHPEVSGRQRVEVHARRDNTWFRCAFGNLGPERSADARSVPTWSPESAIERDPDSLYAALASRGYRYGPTFRGVNRIWQRGETMYAELELPTSCWSEARQRLLHPALLDAAMHASSLSEGLSRDSSAVHMPFSVTDVDILKSGAVRARAIVNVEGDRIRMHLVDEAGDLIARIGGVLMRRIPDAGGVPHVPTGPVAAPEGTGATDHLLRLVWKPAPSPTLNRWSSSRRAVVVSSNDALTSSADGQSIIRCPDLTDLWNAIEVDGIDDCIIDIRSSVEERSKSDWNREYALGRQLLSTTLDIIRRAPRDRRKRLVFVTGGAVGTSSGESIDLSQAALAGFLRSVHAELGAAVVWCDAPLGEPIDLVNLLLGLDVEPELAIRDGKSLVPRLEPVSEVGAGALDFAGKTVLLSGGTGSLGRSVAHFVAYRGAREIVVLSRRGENAPGAHELAKSLAQLGTTLTVRRCDVTDRTAVAAALGDLRVHGAFHLAGEIADRTIGQMTDVDIDAAMRSKCLGAMVLLDVMATMQLQFFISFSSAAGTLGSAGQANYSAANSYLDALMHNRGVEGQPGQSLAWGLWAQPSEMTSHLDVNGLGRLAISGVVPLSEDSALRLLDRAIQLPDRLLIPIGANLDAVRRMAPSKRLPKVRELAAQDRGAGPHARAETPKPNLQEDARMSDRERGATPPLESPTRDDTRCAEALTFIRRSLPLVAPALEGQDLPSTAAFVELGIDSLAAVELRDILEMEYRVELEPSVAFDHPTLQALAEHMASLSGSRPSTSATTTGSGSTPFQALPSGATMHNFDDVSFLTSGSRPYGAADAVPARRAVPPPSRFDGEAPPGHEPVPTSSLRPSQPYSSTSASDLTTAALVRLLVARMRSVASPLALRAEASVASHLERRSAVRLRDRPILRGPGVEGDSVGTGTSRERRYSREPVDLPSPNLSAPGTLAQLFSRGVRSGDSLAAVEMLFSASELVPSFQNADGIDGTTSILTLAAGSALPAVVLYPSLTSISGAHEYVRLAARLEGRRTVLAIPHPGFADRSPLPATVEALVQGHARLIRQALSPHELILAGRSAGGWVAHAVATELERSGTPCRGVALVDTSPPFDAMDATSSNAIAEGLLRMDAQLNLTDDRSLLAMGRYLKLFMGWLPDQPVSTPVWLIKARQRTIVVPGEVMEPWEGADWVIDVAGDHFSMLDTFVDETADALDRLAIQSTGREG